MSQMELDKDLTEQQLREIFTKIDEDKNGCLSHEELSKFVKCLPENISDAEVTKIFKHMDFDGDQKITFPEFYEWYQSKQDNLLNLLYIKQKIEKSILLTQKTINESRKDYEEKEPSKLDKFNVSFKSGDAPGKSEITFKVATHIQSLELSKTIRSALNIIENQPCIVIKFKVQKNQAEAKAVLEQLVGTALQLVEVFLPPDLCEAYLKILDIKVTSFEKNFLLLSISSSHKFVKKIMDSYEKLLKSMCVSDSSIVFDLSFSNGMDLQEMSKNAQETNLLNSFIQGLKAELKLQASRVVLRNLRAFLYKLLEDKQSFSRKEKQFALFEILFSLINGISITVNTKDFSQLLNKNPVKYDFMDYIKAMNKGLSQMKDFISLPISQDFILFLLDHTEPDLDLVLISPGIFAELHFQTKNISSLYNKIINL